MADPVFPRSCYYLAIFLQKLHENENNRLRPANDFLKFVTRLFSSDVSWILRWILLDFQVRSPGIWGEVSWILRWSLMMAERSPLDDVNTVITSLYERMSSDLPGRGHRSDREILASLVADPAVLEDLSFPREALRQNKNLTLAKQLLAQGKYRGTLLLVYFRCGSKILSMGGEGVSFWGRKMPTEWSWVIRAKWAICGWGPGPLKGPRSFWVFNAQMRILSLQKN